MQFSESLIEALSGAKKVAVLTGAGISAESGVPTFRDPRTGLWARYSLEEIATLRALRKDPGLVWRWWESFRKESVLGAKPNPGHVALAAMATLFEEFTLITQNIDGLHQKAGSAGVVELHGNLNRVKCIACGEPVSDAGASEEAQPRCGHCANLCRHDIVLFEENLPEEAISLAFERSGSCEVFLCIGTATVVYPAAELPFTAHRNAAVVVEINPNETPLSPVAQHVLRGASGELLPLLLEEIRRRRQGC